MSNNYPNQLFNCNHERKEVMIEDTDQLRYPHYSDDNWKGTQLIYGKKVEGVHVEYDDRLREFNYESYDRAHDFATSKCKCNTAGWWKEFMNSYFEKNVTIHYIMAGSNLSNGYPYWVLGFSFEEKSK